MTQSERAKIIYNEINTHKKKQEISLNASENGKGEKGKCHVCGTAGHKMKKVGTTIQF
jgi:hypothetical protein